MRLTHGSHWGAFEANIDNGRLKTVRPFHRDGEPSPILDGIPDAVYHDCRVAAPMVRSGWLEQRDRRRGEDPFVEVSWDEALDLVAGELERVKSEYGNEAIFAGSYGWASAGRFHHANTQLKRFMNCFGGYTGQRHNYSVAAALAILPHVVGDIRPLKKPTSWDAIAADTQLIVAFGGVGTLRTQMEPGGVGGHSTEHWLRQLAERNVEVVSITPLRSDTPDFLNAEWIAPRPNTDVALMLALAHSLVEEGLHDADFLNRCTTGFDRFQAYLTGAADGQPKSAAWAAEICDVPVDRIVALARRMAARRTMIATAYSLQRADHGEQPFWMTVALAAILGQVGLPGGGFGYGYGSMHGQGNPVAEMIAPSHTEGVNPTGSFIPVARIADMLLNPGAEYDFDGERRSYPETRIIYWCGGNPFHHHQDLNRLLDGWRRPDTVIVHEPWWTATAKLADIVLPATTTLERNDIGSSSKDRFIIAMKQAVPPQFSARHDFEIFRDLARRVGVEDRFAMGRDELAWLRHIYDEARENARNRALELPDFDRFWDAGFVELTLPATPHNLYADFRDDPARHPLATASGKFEIYSSEIAGFAYDDCPGHPVWIEPAEWLGGSVSADWPLHLISNQPKTRLHSQLDFVGVSLESKIKDREPIMLSSGDAERRGIRSGDLVRVFNSRGETVAAAVVTSDLRDGVAQLPTGAWFDPETPGRPGSLEKHGNPNVLTLDKGTSSLGQGPISHTTLVEIEKFSGEPPAPTAFAPCVTRRAVS